MVRWKRSSRRTRRVISREGATPARETTVDSPPRGLAELQRAINAIAYPPNHCYNLMTMEGSNSSSAARFAYLLPHVSSLVKDKVVLDVGCSKGFFTLWCAEHGAKKVIAQDTNQGYVQLVSEIARAKGLGNVVCTDVSISRIGSVHRANGLVVTAEGDVALVLGVGHYLTYESGLEWIYRLYFLGYDMLLEWPRGGSDSSVRQHRRRVAVERVALLNEASLRAKIDGLYDITLLGQSPDLHRPLYLLRKKGLPEIPFAEVSAGSLIRARGTSRIFMRGDREVVIFKPIHRRQGTKGGYARRWVRGQQILAKEFPEIVPRVSAIVVGDDGVCDGVIEDFLDGSGDRRVGAKRLFDVQIFLVKRNLILLDMHISDVVGAGVVDFDGMEVLNDETERWFRSRIPQTWRRNNPSGVRGLNMDCVEAFARLVGTGKPLLDILREGRELAYHG